VEDAGERRQSSLEERLSIYSRVRELRSQGMKNSEVASTLGISSDMVGYWLRAEAPRVQRYSPDLTHRPELAYLVGAYLGDGRTAGPQDKKVRFKVADIEFANLLNELVAKVLGASPKPITMERGFHCVDYDCAPLYDFLQQELVDFTTLIGLFPEMFLRGFFDAEGYATPMLKHSQKRFAGIMLGVVNTNADYLTAVQNLMLSFGLHSRFVTTHKAGDPMTIRGRTFIRRRDVQHLIVTRRADIELFHERVGFSIPEKKTKLDDMIIMRRQMSQKDGYSWFVSNYENLNHKWTKRYK